jgi:hypothetical protein
MTTQTVTLEQAVKEARAAMLAVLAESPYATTAAHAAFEAVLEAYGFDAEEYDHDHGIG